MANDDYGAQCCCCTAQDTDCPEHSGGQEQGQTISPVATVTLPAEDAADTLRRILTEQVTKLRGRDGLKTPEETLLTLSRIVNAAQQYGHLFDQPEPDEPEPGSDEPVPEEPEPDEPDEGAA